VTFLLNKMSGVTITGVGGYLPPNVITNRDLSKKYNVTEEWLYSRSGINERHLAHADQYTSDLAFESSKLAIADAGIDASSIGMIIIATSTADLAFPSTACILQNKLTIKECIAFDIQAACTGFIYALSIATKFIENADVSSALVVGAETLSRIQNPDDISTELLFGDGAGAVILSASPDKKGIISSHIRSDARYKDLLYATGGISNRGGNIYATMDGPKLFKQAVIRLSETIDETLRINNLSKEDIDWLVPHQANRRIIDSMARRYGFDLEHVIITVGSHANTSAATVPLALYQGVIDGKIQRGDLLLFIAFGAGFTWGSALVEY